MSVRPSSPAGTTDAHKEIRGKGRLRRLGGYKRRMTYQRKEPPRRPHSDRGQVAAPQLRLYRLPHPTKNLLLGKGRRGHPGALNGLTRPHLKQPPPPSHQRQHPPVVEGSHDHSHGKATAPQPLQPLQKRLQLGLVVLWDAVLPPLWAAPHNPPSVGGKSSIVVAKIEPARVPSTVG